MSGRASCAISSIISFMMGNALIAFGGNLGAVEETYLEVISRLHASHGIGVMGAGRLFDTTPIGGPPGQPAFKNGAILVDVSISPFEVLTTLQEIETSLGRVRGDHWGPRAIDLDLLLYDDLRESLCINSDVLTLPHPRLHFRRFVLAPANQVAPDMVHPVFGLTLEELLGSLDRTPRVVVVAGEDPDQAAEFAKEMARRAGAPFDRHPISEAEEFVTTLGHGEFFEECFEVAPRVLFWLTDGAGTTSIPGPLLRQLKYTRFSTWQTLDASAAEAAIVEGAAAIAAMRPFAKQ